jgi:ATP-dependent DNA ligase
MCGFWPLEERREQLHKITQRLPPVAIRYSETFNAPVQQLIRAVKEHRLEGIIAKRAGSRYRSGKRCEDWLKWRANRGQEFVIGGYVPNGGVLDSILVGYYDPRQLIYAGRVRSGLRGAAASLAAASGEATIHGCPFSNLPERTDGRWGDGLTAAKMEMCRWLDPVLVARIEFLEWTPENRLRHPRFAGLRSDKDAREVVRGGGS